jgi:hypothetical protein
MEPEGSFSWLQEPSTGTYLQPVQSSPYHSILSLLRSILIISTHLHLSLISGFFPYGFRANILHTMVISVIFATCPVYLILLNLIFLITLGKKYKL